MSAATPQQLALVGMFLADQAAGQWVERWDAAIAELAASGVDFTADDVRRIAGAPGDHPNAAGARFHSAARKGLIRKVGFRRSERAVLHAHHIALWRGVSGGTS